MSSNDFVSVNEKLKKLIPDPVEIDAYNHFCTIIERMIINGHEAHKTIPDFDKCKPEIETYKAHFGNENPKQKKVYLETIFERSQLETKIKSWEREIEKNPKQKDMLEKRIKKAKEKIKELDKKAEECGGNVTL